MSYSPQGRYIPLIGDKMTSNEKQTFQEILDQLRLDIKYLVFDLEATRRERDHYRELLDNPAA